MIVLAPARLTAVVGALIAVGGFDVAAAPSHRYTDRSWDTATSIPAVEMGCCAARSAVRPISVVEPASAEAQKRSFRSPAGNGDNGVKNEHDVIAGAVATNDVAVVFDLFASWLFPDGMKDGLTIVTGPWHQRRTAMTQYIALDVSMKETAISIGRTAGGLAGQVCVRPTIARGGDPQTRPHAQLVVFDMVYRCGSFMR